MTDRSVVTAARRVVVKIGSSLLVDASAGGVKEDWLASLAEDIAGMRVVQSFTREPVQERAFRGVNVRYRDANYETTVLNAIYFPTVDLLSSAATAIVFGYGGWLVYHGDMTAGTLFAFALYLSNFFDPVQQLSQLYNTFLSAIAALDKIVGVLDEQPQVLDASGAIELPRINYGRCNGRPYRYAYGASANAKAPVPEPESRASFSRRTRRSIPARPIS